MLSLRQRVVSFAVMGVGLFAGARTWFGTAARPLPLVPGGAIQLQTLPTGPTLNAADLWSSQPVVMMVTRRPG